MRLIYGLSLSIISSFILAGCQKQGLPSPMAPQNHAQVLNQTSLNKSTPPLSIQPSQLPIKEDTAFSKTFQTQTEPFLKSLGVQKIEDKTFPDHTIIYHFENNQGQNICDVTLMKNQSFPSELPMFLVKAKEPQVRFSFIKTSSGNWNVDVQTRFDKYSHDEIGNVFNQF